MAVHHCIYLLVVVTTELFILVILNFALTPKLTHTGPFSVVLVFLGSTINILWQCFSNLLPFPSSKITSLVQLWHPQDLHGEKWIGSQGKRVPVPIMLLLANLYCLTSVFLFYTFKWRLWIRAVFSNLNYPAYQAKYLKFSTMAHKSKREKPNETYVRLLTSKTEG